MTMLPVFSLHPQDEGSEVLQEAGILLQHYTASQTRRKTTNFESNQRIVNVSPHFQKDSVFHPDSYRREMLECPCSLSRLESDNTLFICTYGRSRECVDICLHVFIFSNMCTSIFSFITTDWKRQQKMSGQ
jgi:hypothetical protein